MSRNSITSDNKIGYPKLNFEKTKKHMERLYGLTIKYRDDFKVENYDQVFQCSECKLVKNRRLFPYNKATRFKKKKDANLANVYMIPTEKLIEQRISLLIILSIHANLQVLKDMAKVD